MGARVASHSVVHAVLCKVLPQATPPPEAAATSSRVRWLAPVPHVSEHEDQSCQSPRTQSVGHAWPLQLPSSTVSGQSAPAPDCAAAMARVRERAPTSQLAEHTSQAAHEPTAQSLTGMVGATVVGDGVAVVGAAVGTAVGDAGVGNSVVGLSVVGAPVNGVPVVGAPVNGVPVEGTTVLQPLTTNPAKVHRATPHNGPSGAAPGRGHRGRSSAGCERGWCWSGCPSVAGC